MASNLRLILYFKRSVDSGLWINLRATVDHYGLHAKVAVGVCTLQSDASSQHSAAGRDGRSCSGFREK